MKLVFFTQDIDIESLVENISGIDVVVTDVLEGLEEAIEDERCLFFIDYDFDKKYVEEVNQELFDHGNVRRIIISSGMRLKDLKKHQKGKYAAHGYLAKPLSLEIINGVLNDYELSDYILDHELENDDPDFDNIPLTSIGGSSGKIKEFSISSEVRSEIEKHSGSKANPDLDSETNRNIQAKFDHVFLAQSNESTSEFAIGADGVPDVPDEVDDIPSLEVNFGDGSEDMTAGFKAGLSPEDGTGEFEINAAELAESNEDESPQEVDMAADNDDIELDDIDLEFDDNQELEEGALEFGGGQDDTGELNLSDASDVDEVDAALSESSEDVGGIEFGDDTSDSVGELEFGSDDSAPVSTHVRNDDDDVSITLDGEDLDIGGDDLQLGGEVDVDVDVESDIDVSVEENEELPDADGLEFGSDDVAAEELPESDDLDFGGVENEVIKDDSDSADDFEISEDTQPTMVAQTGALDTNDISLDDDDIAEFSANTNDATETVAEVTLGDEDLSEELSFDAQDDLDEELGDDLEESLDEPTAATTIAPSASILADESEDIMFDSSDDEVEEAPVPTPAVSRKREEPLPHGQVLESLGQPELLRLQATIKQLREERAGLLSEVDDLKGSVRLLEQDKLTLKAELEEARIEINILKKRHSEENEESRHRSRVLEEKKAFFEEKARTLQKEFDRLSQKVRIDFNKVKQREKELESQLELVTMDSQSQVKSRDMKILELKRKIDSLEFNMENATIREQKSRDDKIKLEERLGKIMKTLRGSIKLLEDDIDLDDETRAQLEKAGKI